MRAGYDTIAQSLRDIAGILDTIADADFSDPWVSLNIQPGGETDDEIVAAVDALGQVLFGVDGQTYALSSGSHHHHGVKASREQEDSYPGVSVAVYQAVTNPEERKLREEIEELRRQRDELAAAAGVDA